MALRHTETRSPVIAGMGSLTQVKRTLFVKVAVLLGSHAGRGYSLKCWFRVFSSFAPLEAWNLISFATECRNFSHFATCAGHHMQQAVYA